MIEVSFSRRCTRTEDYVDDIISAASPNEEGKKLQEEFWGSMEKKWPGIKLQTGPNYKHLSWNITQNKATGEIRKSQRDYLNEIIGIERERKLPCRSNLLIGDPKSPKLIDFFRYQLDPADSFYQYARPGCLYTS